VCCTRTTAVIKKDLSVATVVERKTNELLLCCGGAGGIPGWIARTHTRTINRKGEVEGKGPDRGEKDRQRDRKISNSRIS